MSGALNTWFTYRFASQVLVLVLLALVFFLVEPPEPSMKWNAAFDVGHFLLFAVVTWVLSDVIERLRPGSRPSRTGSIILVVISLLAVASEATQLLTPTRVASLADISRDLAGAAAALALRGLVRGFGITRRQRYLLTAIVAVVTVAVLAPAALVWEVYRARDRAFPALLALDGAWQEQWRIVPRGATLENVPCPPPAPPAETRCAVLAFSAGAYPGVLIDEPYPDWTGYQYLAFSIWSDGPTPVVLGLDVFDRNYDGSDATRFNENIPISTGHNDILLPLLKLRHSQSQPSLDLRAIRGVRIYAVRPRAPGQIVFSSVHLK